MNGCVRIDISRSDPVHRDINADVCIVGAGAAGIYLGTRLAAKGLDVVVLEAGPLRCVDAEQAGFRPVFDDSYYPGASEGRFFGVGGSTSRWGGQLVPHSMQDLRSSDSASNTWGHIVGIVDSTAKAVLQHLGFAQESGFEAYAQRALKGSADVLAASGIAVQASLVLPFRLKNLSYLLDQLPAHRRLRLFYNAVVCEWTPTTGHGNGATIESIRAVSENGKALTVHAGRFVVAAGAIESARVLLELEQCSPAGVLRTGSAPGRYLADHLSVAIADVEPADRDIAAHLFAPRFSGAWMRSFRFLDSATPPHGPRAFGHFVFPYVGSGFDLAKELLGSLQRRRLPRLQWRTVAAGTTELARLAYDKLVKARLHIPSGTGSQFQLDVEQLPAPGNRVTLGGTADRFGRPQAHIAWSVSDADMDRIHQTARRFLAAWPGAHGGIPRLVPRSLGIDGSKPHDAYHPVGTCRMGNGDDAVVDHALKVRGVDNLWVASTGVLPSAGTANPTFTLLCLCHRLSEELEKQG